jgi:hypothetical protein
MTPEQQNALAERKETVRRLLRGWTEDDLAVWTTLIIERIMQEVDDVGLAEALSNGALLDLHAWCDGVGWNLGPGYELPTSP